MKIFIELIRSISELHWNQFLHYRINKIKTIIAHFLCYHKILIRVWQSTIVEIHNMKINFNFTRLSRKFINEDVLT